MKRVFISAVVFFIATQFSFSQISNGFWQEKTQNVSDAYLGGYHFTDKTFEYTINGYDGLNPITAFGGEYAIKNGKIFFSVTEVSNITLSKFLTSLSIFEFSFKNAALQRSS